MVGLRALPRSHDRMAETEFQDDATRRYMTRLNSGLWMSFWKYATSSDDE